jgi:hypothetical protein
MLGVCEARGEIDLATVAASHGHELTIDELTIESS